MPTVDLTVDLVDLTKQSDTVDLTKQSDTVDLTREPKDRTRYGRVDLTSLVSPSLVGQSSSAPIVVRPTFADNPFLLSDKAAFRSGLFYRPDAPVRLLDKVKCLSDNSLFAGQGRPTVRRVNSFQDKIDKFKWCRDDFLPKFRDASARLSASARKIGEQLEAESKCAAAIADDAIAERIERQLKEHLKITEALLDDEDVEQETVLPTLDDAMLAKIRYAQNRSLNSNEILVSKFRLDIRRCDLLTLSGLSWLNDNVINFYMEMIAERSQNNSKYPKVYAFNTFFYSTLSSSGYQRVRRFTKKVDIFEKDVILVPVHLSVHWCMAKIDMKKKQVVYYDSMHSTNKNALDTLLDYVASEHKDKKNQILDMSGWTAFCDKTVPQQQNGSDCGVFACTFAEYSSRNAKFTFSQENMPYMRMRMVYEICTGELLIK
ncbi:unnamed protein product [Nesidiocoris tenuis]|uniref:Ubiquitin-like protease family profile domain-containing protein n=1 Tax=Nesidiocoris tenuis TaxID=355587 RepID=A0A6H5GRD4_9HEMI|nr:unnamed protein product [Nesidiocoris tenuis]